MEKDIFGHDYGKGEDDVKLADFIFSSTPEKTDMGSIKKKTYAKIHRSRRRARLRRMVAGWLAAAACVAVVALYEEDQVLPLPRMYGKNLIFKTGGVDAIHSDRLISLIASGKIDTRPLITHTFPLSRIMDAYSLFERHAAGCVKCAIRPDDAQEG